MLFKKLKIILSNDYYSSYIHKVNKAKALILIIKFIPKYYEIEHINSYQAFFPLLSNP